MQTYILNAAVIPNYGQYRFSGPLSVIEARALLEDGFESAIGHDASAAILSQVLEREIPVKRQAIAMQPGDRALVFRLVDRLPEGAVLDVEQLRALRYELAKLEAL